MVYFLIGATHKSNEQQVWLDIEKYVLAAGLSRSAKGKLYAADLSRYKMGNLDQLMFINDNLIKQDTVIESLLKKIERQYLDVTEKVTHDFAIESREGAQNIETYVMNFKWDDTRFPRNQVLADILKALQQRTAHVDGDLRTKVQQFQEVKNQSLQVAKKEGNLLVRDLVDVLKEPIVKQRDFAYSDYLTTVVAIVPKTQVPDWLACYEFLTENVVPKSAKQFQIDDKDGFTLWRVVLVKQPLDHDHDEIEEIAAQDQHKDGHKKQKKLTPVEEFIHNARDKLKVTIREFDYKAQEARDREKQRHDLKSKSDHHSTILKQACEKAFSDLYITYLHLKNLRLVVDIAMRFGVNDPLVACILKPDQGKEKKIQQALLKLFAEPSQVGLYGTKEELEDTEDFFPFVYIPVNVP